VLDLPALSIFDTEMLVCLDFVGDAALGWVVRQRFFGEQRGDVAQHEHLAQGAAVIEVRDDVRVVASAGVDPDHLGNFVESIRGNATPNAEIAEGVKSVMFCHLAHIAYRTGHTIDYDGKRCQIVNDPEAVTLWGREYEDGWKPVF
jgi:hypothetical protein